jgi:hypothetical protein
MNGDVTHVLACGPASHLSFAAWPVVAAPLEPRSIADIKSWENFDTAGHKIVVANVATGDLPARATRVEVDKSAKLLKVFCGTQRLLAVYPATVGSEEKPAPSGQLTVTPWKASGRRSQFLLTGNRFDQR